MRKLTCLEVHGMSTREVLEEFNERVDELGIASETDIVSVSELTPLAGTVVATLAGRTSAPKVRVLIVYWASAEARPTGFG